MSTATVATTTEFANILRSATTRFDVRRCADGRKRTYCRLSVSADAATLVEMRAAGLCESNIWAWLTRAGRSARLAVLRAK